MSNIFDALQRAEAESAGAGHLDLSLATELLRSAELKMRESALVVEQQPKIDSFDANPPAPTSPDGVDGCPVLPVCIREESRMVAVAEEGSLGAEKFRFLAVRLRHLRQNRPLKKILITSTIPHEGKSTIAANLACTLARRKNQKVLLLEGDLRRPNIVNQFGIGKLPGLCEWLSGKTENVNICKLEGLGLWVLPAGAAPENPLELMQSGKLSLLMEQLEAWFDWIVIDSPPVLPLADTSLWSRLADGILLVTRPEVTQKKQLQRGLAALDLKKVLGAVVNDSTDVTHSDYYQQYGSPASPESRDSKKVAGSEVGV
jgi:capsular exopolysaccharide synthesis family protein